MDKYKELSKQLRYCGDEGKCQSCEFYRETEPCSQNLFDEAANAIEELLQRVESVGNALIRKSDAIDALAYFDEVSPTGKTAQQVVMDLPNMSEKPTGLLPVWTDLDDIVDLGEYSFSINSNMEEKVNDLISRQAAIDATYFEPSYTDPLIVLTEVRDRLKVLPSAQRWIPCDKGEPDEDMECWVTGKTTYALYRGNFTKRYGERRDKGFITSGGFMWWNTALAWMPIYEPEPYSTEGDDNHEG